MRQPAWSATWRGKPDVVLMKEKGERRFQNAEQLT
jgi:hypothetical protein